MKKELSVLLDDLKQNNEDYELYPTSKDMIEVIYNDIKNGNSSTWLDIGAGTCNFKKYFKELHQLDTRNSWQIPSISQYYAIEKSKILVEKFDKDTICIGRDFNTTYLIDKPVDYIFCNPPYSEYAEWIKRIIQEANFSEKAYMVIPQRWKENEELQNIIQNSKYDINVLYSSDFLNAERQARAKVDVISIDKSYYSRKSDYNDKAFDQFFDEFFTIKEEKFTEEYKQQEIKNKLVNSDSKAVILQQLYDDERNRLFNSFKSICALDSKTLNDIGVDKNKVKEALKFQISGLKSRYWKLVFDEFSEITDRLTKSTRDSLMNRFKNIKTIDFCVENIYPILVWVIKNSNEYYESQLIDWFKKISSPENVKNYKSNKKVFEKDGYRYTIDKDKFTHYTLDYRIIMSSPFRVDWNGRLDCDYNTQNTLNDIFVLAKNLGFNVDKNYTLPYNFGIENTIHLSNGETFMKYRVYKNGNMHVKFNIEFMKAVNVEVSRLLGWIRSTEDIQNEFVDDMKVGAGKYFKQNFNCIDISSTKLLGVNN